MKYGDIVIYFCTEDQKASNNTSAIAPAQVVIPWGHADDGGKPTCNLKVN